MSQDQSIPMEKSVNNLGGPIVEWDKVSRDLQGGANSVSQVNGVPDMVPTCWLYGSVALWLWGGRIQERDNGLCLPFYLGESCPPALALMPDTSATPCMPLVPFKLLLRCWSLEGVTRSKCVWVL